MRYTYKCKTCEHIFDARHSVSEVIEDCPECGESVRKVITGFPAVKFVGKGFYSVDNKKGGLDRDGRLNSVFESHEDQTED